MSTSRDGEKFSKGKKIYADFTTANNDGNAHCHNSKVPWIGLQVTAETITSIGRVRVRVRHQNYGFHYWESRLHLRKTRVSIHLMVMKGRTKKS